MAERREIGAIYTAAVVQGVALVTFPAASTIFTSSSYYGLSRTEYGGMFLPQVATAIAAFVAAFFPLTIDRVVLVLNALLGLGTVLAPVLVLLVIGAGDWSGLPLSVATIVALVMAELSFVVVSGRTAWPDVRSFSRG